MNKFASIIFSLSVASTLPAFSITVSEVVDAIASNNISLQAQELENKSEILSLRKENSLPPTAIEFSPFFTSGESGMSSSELIVRQDFEFPTIYANRSKSANLRQNALQKDMDLKIRQLKADARTKCLELIYARKCREIIQKRISIGDSLLSSYELKYRLEEVNLLEVNKIKLANSDLRRELAENTLLCSNLMQNIQLLNSGKAINLDSLTYEYSAVSYPLPSDIEELKNNSADILSATATVKAAQAEVAVGKQSWLPSLSIGYRRNTDGPTVSNGVLVGAEFPLFSIGKESKAASARLAASNLTLQNAEYEATIRLLGELERLKTLQSSMAQFDADSPILMQTLQLLRKSLELGQISLTDYYIETGILYDRMQTRATLENDFQTLLTSLYQ